MFAIFLLYFCIYIYILGDSAKRREGCVPEFGCYMLALRRQKTQHDFDGNTKQRSHKHGKPRKYEKSKPYLTFFFNFMFFLRSWVNGLDLNRFCAPEQIIEKSNSSFFFRFWILLEKWLSIRCNTLYNPRYSY